MCEAQKSELDLGDAYTLLFELADELEVGAYNKNGPCAAWSADARWGHPHYSATALPNMRAAQGPPSMIMKMA